MPRGFAVLLIVLGTLVSVAGCGRQPSSPQPAARLSGSATEGSSRRAQFLASGRELIDHTAAKLPHNVGSRVNCSSCHIGAGTKSGAFSFAGVAARFPQWNQRSHRYIALQDRIAECFLRSENGTPPPYSSREMIAMVAYITEFSRNRMLAPFPATRNVPLTVGAVNERGPAIYAAKCAMCHGATGAGSPGAPPLWGRFAFNDGAGMMRLQNMVPFVLRNMPASHPGSLTPAEALAVSAFVLKKPRPRFNRTRMIASEGRAAGSF